MTGSRSLQKALLSSNDQVKLSLTGQVPPNTHKSLGRLADAFGLNSEDALTNWMASEAFQRFYKILRQNVKPMQHDGKTQHQGPTLTAVKKAITNGEIDGVKKYSSEFGLDTSQFKELDWYAYCLVKLTTMNSMYREGIFFMKNMTEHDMHVRLWQAILRENYSEAPSRRLRINQSLSSSHNGAAAPSTDNGDESPRANREEGEAEPDEALRKSDWNLMKDTANANDPFDINTRYGKFLTIYIALKEYKDPMKIQTLFVQQGQVAGEEPDIEGFNQESALWYQELEDESKKNQFNYRQATEDEVAGVSRMERLLDNPIFQRLEYTKDCASLGVKDPSFPRFECMMRTMRLESWQVCGIQALLDFEANKSISGCIIADSTGLGKTIQCVGYWEKRIEVYKRKIEAYNYSNIAYEKMVEFRRRKGLHGPLQRPPLKPLAKPMLLVAPAEIITQWEQDINRFNPKLIRVTYYGPKITSRQTAGARITGMLTRKAVYFDGHEDRAMTVIITSPETLRARHGPGALQYYRVAHKGWSSEMAKAAMHEQDPSWERNLSGLFSVITIDEAHSLKNADSAVNTTISWLKPGFIVLATATVLPNGIKDCEGFIKLIQPKTDLWAPENLAKLGVSPDVNPYELSDGHPATILQLSLEGARQWITSEAADKDKSGFYLQKIWKQCLLRRTYASKNPQNHLMAIGESLPKLFTRCIVSHFSPAEKKEYDTFAANPLRKLAHFLPNGQMCWNRRYARELTLLSTSISYHWTNIYLTADATKEFREKEHCLWTILKLLHDRKADAMGDPGFALPEKHETAKLLALICQGSPKLRQLLQILSSLVILSHRKVTIWCSLPANQVLIGACLQCLQIEAAIYTADRTSIERQNLVHSFTRDPEGCRVWVGSYSVGSVGLNLQAMCNHSINFDSPLNTGQAKQAIGRIRRLKQPLTVEQFELSVEDTFQSRVIQNALRKAVPGTIADLTMEVHESDAENLTKAFSIGRWFRVGDQLIEAPDYRVNHLLPSQQLSAPELVAAIMDISRGRREESQLDQHWVEEEVEEDIDVEMIDAL